ncbi:hypothetical protein [Veillonella rodentium]|uniref:Niacin ECF transporter S component NiaX n=1 Tax=Veillonella rodentium TaxID=248315 RepID=A0A239Y9J5_9FIRM|nr:hypothetical protein [Veillonella rodentium]SNV54894.1 Niacin ECF transporter S component NiaX [Veillonella rodentium]
MTSSTYRDLTITALLMALAIMIPIVMPLKVVIPPASYTLASHVPIFLAMFLSRKMTACVVFGSTLGFFVAGFPLVIVMRAASHILFAMLGALYIRNHQAVLSGGLSFALFNLGCAVVHAVGEVLACLLFYTTTTLPNIDLVYVVFGLVGGGTIIHSLVDGYISLYIYRAIPKRFLLDESK